MLEILLDISSAIEVPADDVRAGIAPAPASFAGDGDDYPPLIRIHSGAQPPERPFVTVEYQGHWFWIEESDFRSKRTISYLLVLLALSDTGAKESLPVITIQAN